MIGADSRKLLLNTKSKNKIKMRQNAQNYTKQKVAPFIEAADLYWHTETPPTRYKVRLLFLYAIHIVKHA